MGMIICTKCENELCYKIKDDHVLYISKIWEIDSDEGYYKNISCDNCKIIVGVSFSYCRECLTLDSSIFVKKNEWPNYLESIKINIISRCCDKNPVDIPNYLKHKNLFFTNCIEQEPFYPIPEPMSENFNNKNYLNKYCDFMTYVRTLSKHSSLKKAKYLRIEYEIRHRMFLLYYENL